MTLLPRAIRIFSRGPPSHVFIPCRYTTDSTSTMAQLKVHNSLKPGPPVPFIPIEEGKVSWYVCGPTVYDHSHLGHARNYVSTDIIRRIMMHYFGFKVKFVMNITDVDDKIILRARRLKLLELEKSKKYSQSELSKLGTAAFEAYAKGNLPELLKSPDGSNLSPSNYIQRRDTAYGKVLAGGTLTGVGKPGDDEAKMKMHLSNLTAATTAIQDNNVFPGADEILLPYVDSLYKETVDARDHTIWTEVTQYWEKQFLDDMDALNVLRADVITRVTAYVPQIALFVEKIVQKGFAYEADGSVYFDIGAFEKGGNQYAKLRPESKNDKALQEEGEGSLGKSLGGKRGAGDFALWKKSKAGEPSWPSPWGDGRPGWHIECSVMASDILGSQMDIHSGGVDLAFPHHDNELAQSEAYFCDHGHEHTWVNYFMHMGHLSISGSKMSKSLKNFQTIRDALATDYTPRNMRIAFLLGRWNDGVEISPDMRMQANSWESSVNNFFITVKSHLIAVDPETNLKSLSIEDSKPDGLGSALEKAQTDMTAALSNSFDTPQALQIINALINKSNINLKESAADLDLAALEKIAQWITKIVGIFGLDANASPPYEGLGWASEAVEAALTPDEIVEPYAKIYQKVKAQVEGLSVHSEVLDQLLALDVNTEFKSRASSGVAVPESLAFPYIRGVSRIRDELRKIAPSSPSKKELLTLSDEIRDSYLTDLDVFLQDETAGTPSFIKFIPQEEIIAQRAAKAAEQQERIAQKEAAKVAREKEAAEKAAKARINPAEMFRDEEKYSAWDDKGIPTKTKDGEEVTKSARKKLEKEWERQNKAYTEWKAKSGGA